MTVSVSPFSFMASRLYSAMRLPLALPAARWGISRTIFSMCWRIRSADTETEQQRVDRPRASQEIGPGEGADDVVDQERHREQQQDGACRVRSCLVSEDVGDGICKKQAYQSCLDRYEKAAFENSHPYALEEIEIGGESEGRSDTQPGSLPEADHDR